MNIIKEKYKGLLVCLAIAIPAWILGKIFPIIGSAVIAIIAGMVLALFWQPGKTFKPGITFTSKKILQYAVILLGFGLNLNRKAITSNNYLYNFHIFDYSIRTSQSYAH